VLLNETGKYNISDAWWKESDKRGCKIGSWRVICILRFSNNSAQAVEGGRFSSSQPLYPTALLFQPTGFWGMKFLEII
jgi:hypothetical protein